MSRVPVRATSVLLRLQLTTHSFVVTKPVTFFERNRKNSVPGTLFCETRFTSVDVGGGLLENRRGFISQVPEPWATRQACRFWSCPGLPLSHSGGVGAARTAHDGYSPALRRERASTAPSSSALLWLNPSELHSSAGASPHTSKFRGVSPVSLSGVPLAPLRPHSSQAAAGLSCLCTSIPHPHGSWFRAR